MRLKSLEIKGFKSFGDKVIIHFDKGVTSIVGPNGSGKSNVVDAMRWALGEQKTRMLRSEKMENIIFNGTKTRKQSNLAEVSLSFENTKNILPTEFSNVTITRKLYRTGESEYQLNGINCRLKDITDLFLDTGIGSDSYSIIELKMIDEIINDKNNTIKLLFEEAAGISKYKIRKRQTFQKLEETDADLYRVNDLLFEIEKNLKTLETQAKKTERFYKIKEQYKELSTQVAQFSIAGHRRSFDDLQKQEQQQQDIRIQIETQIIQAESQIEKQKIQSLDQEKHLAESQKALNEKLGLIRQRENDKKIKNERLGFLADKETLLNKQLDNDKQYIAQLQDAIENHNKEQTREKEELDKIAALFNELKTIVETSKAEHIELQTSLRELQKSLQNTQDEAHRLEKNFAIRKTQQQASLQETARLKQDNESKQSELVTLATQLSEVIITKEKQERELAKLMSSEQIFEKEIKTTEDVIKNINDSLILANRRLDAKQNEYNLTKSLLDNLEGFPESIKFLKKKVSHLQNAPLLSDLISCASEYKPAIENYLEPFMNYFVLQNMQEASLAVNLLNESSQGRANFFIMDAIPIPVRKKGEATHPSNCIAALDVIDPDDKYQTLFNYLLNGVYIVQQEQENTPFMGLDIDKSIVLISQNGKFQRTKISLSGGSIGLFDGKRIGRAKNLEILSKEIKITEAERVDLKSTIDKHYVQLNKTRDGLAQVTGQHKSCQEQLNETTQTFSTLHIRQEQIQKTININNERIADIESQIKAIEGGEEMSDEIYETKIQAVKNEREQYLLKLSETQETFNKATQYFNEQSATYNRQNIILLQQQNKIATIVRDINYKSAQTDQLNKTITNNTTELENIRVQIQQTVASATTQDSEMLEMYAEKEKQEKAVTELESLYFKSRGETNAQEEKIKELRRRKEQADVLLQSVKDKVTELKIQLNSLKERLQVEFSISLEDLMEQGISDNIEEEDVRKKLERIKEQIANYGAINPMAIEAFKEINERYTFILKQKEDLANAKASLLQTIQEIDSTAKEKFMQAFTLIRGNFIKVFRSLFSEEDNCDLILMDANNPIDADINIIAQPKGKRPLSINQLSGGEKTLTATALLFGIYLLKPAPFCIFDEVDAPLDDTNIDKFNRIIKKFSEDSQFIIITHNKRTMASTDIIYGVTMIETGVTQVVPVDLREVA